MTGAQATAEPAAYLLDIEGTTTPVSFVFDVLFPYAREHLGEYLLGCRNRPELAELAGAFSATADEERAQGQSPPAWTDGTADETVESIRALAGWMMERDRKSTALKELQGRIWRAGYESGELRGQVYEDVVPALRRWRARGATIAIFSSGSVAAQKLLFGHTTEGDLTALIDAYFDTTTGPKREPSSYRLIATHLGRRPDDVLFLSDVTAELDAAREAGLRTALCVRDAAPAPSHTGGHPVLHHFDQPPAAP